MVSGECYAQDLENGFRMLLRGGGAQPELLWVQAADIIFSHLAQTSFKDHRLQQGSSFSNW